MNNGPERDLELLAKYISAFCKKNNAAYLSLFSFDTEEFETNSIHIAIRQKDEPKEITNYTYGRNGKKL